MLGFHFGIVCVQLNSASSFIEEKKARREEQLNNKKLHHDANILGIFFVSVCSS